MGEFEKEILKTLVPAIISSDNQVKQAVKTY